MISFQDRMARKLAPMQNKLMDKYVEMSGTKSNCIIMEIMQDKYHNEMSIIKNLDTITCMFNFPEDEIPVNLVSTQNNMNPSSSQTFHLYDVVPITCFFRTEDVASRKIKQGTIVLYKMMMMDGTFECISFQVTDAVAKGNPSSAILWQEFTVAPVTQYELLQNETYKEITNNFKTQDSETWINLYHFETEDVTVDYKGDEIIEENEDKTYEYEDNETKEIETNYVYDKYGNLIENP